MRGDGTEQRQQKHGDDGIVNQPPVFQNAHGRGDEKDGQDGHQKAPGILHLLQFDNAEAQGGKQQDQSINGCGHRQGNDPLEQFSRQREGGNTQELG